jgi:predicted MFS family arabinose efflux permease
VPSRSPDDALGAIIAGALGYGGAIAIVAGLTAASGIWSFTTCPPTAARQPRQLRL